MYYFFSVKQNVKDIFIDIFFDKTFEDIRENELDFHDYGTAKIEFQQQPPDINPLTCELHQIVFVVLDFNPALKVIHPGFRK